MDTVSSAAFRSSGRGFQRGSLPLIAVCLLATGCTMCPDPFDYAGPVPNGAVSQNDFAARSNGILPVRATPLPWPPIVDSAPRRPTPAGTVAGEEGALIATVSPIDVTDGPDEVSILEASLTAPAEGATAALEGTGEPQVGEPNAAEIRDLEPARALRQVSSRRMVPTPSADDSAETIPPADESSEGKGAATILESRLPKETPRVLLR